MTDNLLKPETLLFVRKHLEADDVQGLGGPLRMPGDADLRTANVSLLLPLLHEAREKNPKAFWVNLFLPWISIQRFVEGHHDRILREFRRIAEFQPGTQEFLIHLVNLYRSIVSDLLDPYMTLLVACFQFIEGEFTNLVDANVGQGERNKAEYLERRIRRIDPENRLLSGYEAIVRNAVAHSGSEGVSYGSSVVLFRNIKRGSPAVVEAVEWPQDTLIDKIVRLFESIISIDAAVNVFGVDCSELILGDEEVRSEFLQRALTTGQRAGLRAPFEGLMREIREDKNITDNKRFELLSQVLQYNCAKRKMPVYGIRVSRERRMVMVEIPNSQQDLADDGSLLDLAIGCGHYAVLARSVFGPDFHHVILRTVLESGQPRFTMTLAGDLLGEYIEERAGLYDLLHEADFRLDGNKVVISVAFGKVAERERTSLERLFPRKARCEERL